MRQNNVNRVKKIDRVNKIGKAVGSHFPGWGTIFHTHGGKSLSMVGSPACLVSRQPSRGEAASRRLHKEGAAKDIPMDGFLGARQAENSTVKNN